VDASSCTGGNLGQAHALFPVLSKSLTFCYLLISNLVMIDDNHGFVTMEELTARLEVRTRQEEALRYAALREAGPRRWPIGGSVAAILRNLADRIEPAPERGHLAHQ